MHAAHPPPPSMNCLRVPGMGSAPFLRLTFVAHAVEKSPDEHIGTFLRADISLGRSHVVEPHEVSGFEIHQRGKCLLSPALRYGADAHDASQVSNRLKRDAAAARKAVSCV